MESQPIRTYRVRASSLIEGGASIVHEERCVHSFFEAELEFGALNRCWPGAIIALTEVCVDCERPGDLERWDGAMLCVECRVDPESTLALADAEGYDMNDLEGELARFAPDQIDFIEFTLGIGGF
jgi:hypothetical protein